MTQEEKDLLLKDLCGRLPYGVKIELRNSQRYHHENISKGNRNIIDTLKGFTGKYFTIYHDNPLDWDWSDSDIEVEDIKPYLFPMSSMTEEQRKEYTSVLDHIMTIEGDVCDVCTIESINWLLKNHFDVNNLIPLGLAKDATGLNIY